MYAYIHFMSKERSRTIIEKLPLKEMLIDYKLGHEMSKETYYQKIAYLISPLQSTPADTAWPADKPGREWRRNQTISYREAME